MSYGFRACLNAVRAQRVSSKRTGNRKVQNSRRRRRRRVPAGAGGVPCRVRAAPNRCLPLPSPACPLALSHASLFARFLGVLTIQYSFNGKPSDETRLRGSRRRRRWRRRLPRASWRFTARERFDSVVRCVVLHTSTIDSIHQFLYVLMY